MKHPDGFQVLIAIDQLVNTLIGGMADETLSSRAYRHYIDGSRKWPAKFINFLFFWQKDHCREAYESEINRVHLPKGINMIKEPLLLGETEKEEEFPFGDCFPIFSYGISCIPKESNSMGCLGTLAERDYSVYNLAGLSFDGSSRWESNGVMGGRDVSPKVIGGLSNAYIVEIGKDYLPADGTSPECSRLVFVDVGDPSFMAGFTCSLNESGLPSNQELLDWYNEQNGTDLDLSGLVVKLQSTDSLYSWIRGVEVDYCLVGSENERKIVYVDLAELNRKGIPFLIPSLDFEYLAEGRGEISVNVGASSMGFIVSIPVTGSAYTDFMSTEPCGEPLWDTAYKSAETDTPLYLSLRLWMSPKPLNHDVSIG